MYGFEVINSSGRVQVSSEIESYVCIRSTVVSGFVDMSYREDDIVTFTYLDGHYMNVYGGVGPTGQDDRTYAYGRHRMCVFRRSSAIASNPVGGDFGIWVGNNSVTTFSSQWYPLVIVSSPSHSSYPSLIYNGGSLDWAVQVSIMGLYVVYYVTTPFLQLGRTTITVPRSTVLTLRNTIGIGPRRLNFGQVIVDVSKIPIEYRL